MKRTPAVKTTEPSIFNFEWEWHGEEKILQHPTAEPGTFGFSTDTSDNIATLDYVCPCGCKAVGSLPIKQDVTGGAWWRWNGDTEKPTLEPSILRMKGCRWHGYLRNGVWEEC